ncbi:MAG: hypothetical protein KBD64_06810, partial [Gammaproteobacteria bacterium]|nr:hypothetical protein [Gammaproteobacteria bacterium]
MSTRKSIFRKTRHADQADLTDSRPLWLSLGGHFALLIIMLINVNFDSPRRIKMATSRPKAAEP